VKESPNPPTDEQLGLAIELSPSGMLGVDVSGIVLFSNRPAERLFGYAHDELIGLPVERLIPERFRSSHPLFRDRYFAEPGERPMGVGRELYALRKDGSEVPVEIGLNPIRGKGGLVVLASIVDITARKRAEQRFQTAVDSSPSGMIMINESGVILLVNQEVERLFGYRRDELIGKSIDALVPERFRSAHPSHRSGFFRDPRSRPMGAGRELFGLRKDGTEVPIEIGLTPIRSDEGMCVLSSIVDITARRQIEEQFRQSQKLEAIGTLAGGIAHDFNNILFSIVGYAEFAIRHTNDEALSADLASVLKAAEGGRMLVQRILTFSRQRELARVPVRLDRPLQEALQLLKSSLPSTIEIRPAIDPSTPEVLSDETQMHQVVMNLATNAAHSMPVGGVMEVRLGPFEVSDAFAAAHPGLRPGLFARLSVRDTGAGMPPEVLQRVFEPFFTTKPAGQGTGLGLSVIHGIVQAHGGVIEIQSQPGEGTRVDIYLPAHEQATAATKGTAAEARRAHVLVVEDEEDLLRLLRRQVEELGYRATAHGSSVEALEDFRARPADFDLLITDNTMPKMTGLTLAREIRRMRPELPILVISGLAEVIEPEQLASGDFDKLLGKPHTWDELVGAITGLLADTAGGSGRGSARDR
jgi:PAS domain S-box-containing protein